MIEGQSRPVFDALRARLIGQARRTQPLLVGVTGSVAVGKSTFAHQLTEALKPDATVEVVSTDGFLLPNEVLDRQGLSLRKGFPETYDAEALFAALAGVRKGQTPFPGYSHITYDIDPALTRIVTPPDILILEGLAFSPFRDGRTLADAVDVLIYLDADEEDLETWFTARFMAHWRAAAHDPASFYARFKGLSAEAADQFARMVWTRINLPNLRDHIHLAKARAQIVLRKTRTHALEFVREKWTPGFSEKTDGH
jgi:type I pantothenate kinase